MAQYDQYATAEAEYGGPQAVEERYQEVRGAIERLTNQIDSAEKAAHELGVTIVPVSRMSDPSTGKDSQMPGSGSGVELADTLEQLANRVQALDGHLRELTRRVAL